MKTEELLELQKKIESSKNRANQLQGRQSQLLKQLQTEFNCNSVEDGEKLLEEMQKEITTLESQIDTGIKELKEKYPALFEQKGGIMKKIVNLIQIVIYNAKGRKLDVVQYDERMTLKCVEEQKKLLAEQYDVPISKVFAYYENVSG